MKKYGRALARAAVHHVGGPRTQLLDGARVVLRPAGRDEVDHVGAVVRAGLQHLAGRDRRGERDVGERQPRVVVALGDGGEAIPCGGRLGEERVEVGRAELVGADRAHPIAGDEAEHGLGASPARKRTRAKGAVRPSDDDVTVDLHSRRASVRCARTQSIASAEVSVKVTIDDVPHHVLMRQCAWLPIASVQRFGDREPAAVTGEPPSTAISVPGHERRASGDSR